MNVRYGYFMSVCMLIHLCSNCILVNKLLFSSNNSKGSYFVRTNIFAERIHLFLSLIHKTVRKRKSHLNAPGSQFPKIRSLAAV